MLAERVTQLFKTTPMHDFGPAAGIDINPVYKLVGNFCSDDDSVSLRVAVRHGVIGRISDDLAEL